MFNRKAQLASGDDPFTKQVINPMMATIVLLIVFGLAITLIQSVADRMTSLLLALACILLGGLVGFLFGIPRVLQADQIPALPITGGATASSTALSMSANQPSYRQEVNTNLEQISDWLTKIIVGLGLVNLYKIPDLLRDTSVLIAQGIGSPKNKYLASIFANSVILYFPVLGFLIGYLITRIFLSGVFKKVDVGGLEFIVGGQEVGLEDVVKNLVNVVTDSKTPDLAFSTLEAKTLPKRILWVDDHPNNNGVERETLSKAGMEVVTAISSKEAIARLNKNTFDLLISDMARTEEGVYNPKAGVSLLSQMELHQIPRIRTIIYCSRKGAEQYGEEARQAGADDVLYGPQALLKAIGV